MTLDNFVKKIPNLKVLSNTKERKILKMWEGLGYYRRVKNLHKTVKILVKNKIPVMGHLGILPQSTKGKFKSKGKSTKEKKEIFRDSKLLEGAGVFSIVLECVEKKLAKEITDSISVPTIGIGSSNNCDGQVLVTDDILGLTESKIKFVKKFTDIKKTIYFAVKKFKKEVKSKKYPTKKYSY